MAKPILQRSLHAATTAARRILLGAFVAACLAGPVFATQDDDIQPDLNALRAKAEAGNVNAQTQLADFFIASDDFTNAVVWYRKAAEQGDLTAQLSLASLLIAGRGASRNPQESAKWLRAAADRIETNQPAFGPGAVTAATTNVPANAPTKAIIITRTNPPPLPPLRAPATNAAAVAATPSPMPPATNPPTLTRVQRAGVANPADTALHEVQPVVRSPQEPR